MSPRRPHRLATIGEDRHTRISWCAMRRAESGPQANGSDAGRARIWLVAQGRCAFCEPDRLGRGRMLADRCARGRLRGWFDAPPRPARPASRPRSRASQHRLLRTSSGTPVGRSPRRPQRASCMDRRVHPATAWPPRARSLLGIVRLYTEAVGYRRPRIGRIRFLDSEPRRPRYDRADRRGTLDGGCRLATLGRTSVCELSTPRTERAWLSSLGTTHPLRSHRLVRRRVQGVIRVRERPCLQLDAGHHLDRQRLRKTAAHGDDRR
jgi:hypothetical protein